MRKKGKAFCRTNLQQNATQQTPEEKKRSHKIWFWGHFSSCLTDSLAVFMMEILHMHVRNCFSNDKCDLYEAHQQSSIIGFHVFDFICVLPLSLVISKGVRAEKQCISWRILGIASSFAKWLYPLKMPYDNWYSLYMNDLIVLFWSHIFMGQMTYLHILWTALAFHPAQISKQYLDFFEFAFWIRRLIWSYKGGNTELLAFLFFLVKFCTWLASQICLATLYCMDKVSQRGSIALTCWFNRIVHLCANF